MITLQAAADHIIFYIPNSPDSNDGFEEGLRRRLVRNVVEFVWRA